VIMCVCVRCTFVSVQIQLRRHEPKADALPAKSTASLDAELKIASNDGMSKKASLLFDTSPQDLDGLSAQQKVVCASACVCVCVWVCVCG